MRQVSHPYTPARGALGSDLDERHALGIDGRPSTPDGRHTNRSSSVGTETRHSFNFTNDSLSLFPTSSSTNVAGATASTRSRTVSPISRNSLEFPFRSKSRTSISTSTDPIARAAAVQAARQAFEDREAAKARKFEKAQDKELFRRERKDQPEQKQPKQKCTYLYGEMNSRPEDSRRQSGSARQSRDLYRDATHGPVEKTEGFKMRDPKSAWLLFLTWLRTRIFKMGRRIKKKSG